jgi:tryptophan synthase beta chain
MQETKVVLPDRKSRSSVQHHGRHAEPSCRLAPGTRQPVRPEDLSAISSLSSGRFRQRWIDIPEEVRTSMASAPSPLPRAHRLEAALGTPAKIYYKYEGVSPAGSHKPNTSIPQAYYNKKAGIRRIATETGAGQWGSSMALAGTMFGLEVTVYMVKVSYTQKPYRRIAMETWGATVHPSSG